MFTILTETVSTLVIYCWRKSIDEEIIKAVFGFKGVIDRIVVNLRGFD